HQGGDLDLFGLSEVSDESFKVLSRHRETVSGFEATKWARLHKKHLRREKQRSEGGAQTSGCAGLIVLGLVPLGAYWVFRMMF
ncbi:hypothetical protein N9A65_03205, partial [Akkermansiaceae bacterium]|nr:hypothetical protein [Akkermansiaceae bacterium]